MAQFYAGLEETPYDGWTLSGLVACGPRLLLTCPVDGLASTTGWTAATGSLPTVEANRFKWAGAAGNTTGTAVTVSGDFDLRCDVDVVTRDAGGARVFRMIATLGSNNVSIALTNAAVQLLTTGASVAATVAQSPLTAAYRLTRVGNLFTAYYRLSADSPGVWNSVGSTTQSYQSSGTVGLIAASGTYKIYTDSLRNALPSATSGTATSPVMDTVDGLRGLGWFSDWGGTGTVLVEYRVGDSSAACSAATYATATNWADISPGAGNRYVQVRLTVSGGSTSAASPEVGPILVNGSLSQANAVLLFNRMAACYARHIDSADRPAIGEAASAGNSYVLTCTVSTSGGATLSQRGGITMTA